MLNFLNRMHDKNFAAMVAAIVLAVILGGGYAGIKAIQNDNRASACEARGGTAYGHDNWLCAK